MAKGDQEKRWRQADDEVRKKLLPGVKLLRTLRGHTRRIGQLVVDPIV